MDKLRYFAVVKNVEIIGEAANIHTHLPIGFWSFGWSTSINHAQPDSGNSVPAQGSGTQIWPGGAYLHGL